MRFRDAPLPAGAAAHDRGRRRRLADPEVLGDAIGRLLVLPPRIDIRHIAVPRVSLGERLAHLRGLLRRGAFRFEEAVGDADRMTVAVTLFALLELYKRGEADWSQPESFGEIAVSPCAPPVPDSPHVRAFALGGGARSDRDAAKVAR